MSFAWLKFVEEIWKMLAVSALA